jgi:DDE family transposase
VSALTELLRDSTAGDPITGLKWTRKTLIKLSEELEQQGFPIGPDTVKRLLLEMGYVLRVNRKRLTKNQDPDRDRQMRYLTRKRRAFLKVGKPVISVDAKQRELIGNFKQNGHNWRQQPLDVLESDYPSEADGIAIPYGIYDLAKNEGTIIIGLSHQTPEFAVAAIRKWWLKIGQHRYPKQDELLIEADCDGGNGNRCWLWKFGLQQLADEFKLSITVTHLPTGASKWNPIEHRCFCFVSGNWAGRPLTSYETMLKFIRTTKTQEGFLCRAYIDKKTYETGLKISREQIAQINFKPHRVLPKWNYTIEPW